MRELGTTGAERERNLLPTLADPPDLLPAPAYELLFGLRGAGHLLRRHALMVTRAELNRVHPGPHFRGGLTHS